MRRNMGSWVHGKSKLLKRLTLLYEIWPMSGSLRLSMKPQAIKKYVIVMPCKKSLTSIFVKSLLLGQNASQRNSTGISIVYVIGHGEDGGLILHKLLTII